MIGPQVERRQQLLRRIRCHDCFENQRELDKLKEEVERLRSEVNKLKREKNKLKEEGPFGSSTPSSKKPFKKKATKESTQAKGGAKLGHAGHGRGKHSGEEVDNLIELSLPEACPDCGSALINHGVRDRSVLELVRPEVEKIIYRCSRGICKRCTKVHTSQPPVLPRALYGNELLTQSWDFHYCRGVSLGKLLDFLGPNVTEGDLIQAFHRVARLFEPALVKLREDYRKSMVKHATGVLIVDRYPGYNKAPCAIQYCYAHLLRDIKKLQDEFENHAEVKEYTTNMANLLSYAMNLRNAPISDKDYYNQAQSTKKQIEIWTSQVFQHTGIRAMQKIFNEKSHRLYHWVTDRRVPCENN